VPKIVKIR